VAATDARPTVVVVERAAEGMDRRRWKNVRKTRIFVKFCARASRYADATS
jgi:hypothetical protein